jgi:uncharacterized protein YxeA
MRKNLIILLASMALISCSGANSSKYVSESQFIQYYGKIEFNSPTFNNGVRTECISDKGSVLACDIVGPLTGGVESIKDVVNEIAKVISAFNEQSDYTSLVNDSAKALEQAISDKNLKSFNKFGSKTYVNIEVKNNNAYITITN